MRSAKVGVLVGLAVVALTAPVFAKEKGKYKIRHDASQSRSTDWERRTDDEWRRYMHRDAHRRTTDGDTRWHTSRSDRMRGLDSNGDGVVTRGEWRGSYQSFSRQDRNGDGVITERDRRFSRERYTGDASGRPEDAGRRNDRLRVLDKNGDGVISQHEWNRR